MNSAKLEVTYNTIYSRTQRKLKEKGQKLYSVRVLRNRIEYFYVADLKSGKIIRNNIPSIVDIAREVGALKPWEVLEGEKDEDKAA